MKIENCIGILEMQVHNAQKIGMQLQILFSYIFRLYEMVLYLVGHNFVHCAVHQYISLIHFFYIGQAGH